MSDTAQTRPRIAPTGSNAATSVGAAIGVLFIAYQHAHGTDYEPVASASVSAGVAAIFTYLHSVVRALVNRTPLE